MDDPEFQISSVMARICLDDLPHEDDDHSQADEPPQADALACRADAPRSHLGPSSSEVAGIQ